jgi:hypothetical protein
VRVREIGRPGPVQQRANLAGKPEVGVDNRDRRTLTPGRAMAREGRLDPAGPSRSTARLGAHDRGYQHVPTAVECLAQEPYSSGRPSRSSMPNRKDGGPG